MRAGGERAVRSRPRFPARSSSSSSATRTSAASSRDLGSGRARRRRPRRRVSRRRASRGSTRAGTLRGMHFQRAPHEEAKLVRCIRGAIFDVVARPAARLADVLGWHGVRARRRRTGRRSTCRRAALTASRRSSTDTDVLYLISAPYVPEASPASAGTTRLRHRVARPASERTIGARDRAWPDYAAARVRRRSSDAIGRPSVGAGRRRGAHQDFCRDVEARDPRTCSGRAVSAASTCSAGRSGSPPNCALGRRARDSAKYGDDLGDRVAARREPMSMTSPSTPAQ